MATQGTINLPDMPQLLVTTGEQVFCHGGGTTGNRVLAIRGDAVLEVLAIDYIVARDPQISFTNLTKEKDTMIKRTERAAAAVRYGLPARLTNVAAADFLNVTNSSIAQAIVFDAYVGGVYAEDHGLERARVWLLAYWDLLNAEGG